MRRGKDHHEPDGGLVILCTTSLDAGCVSKDTDPGGDFPEKPDNEKGDDEHAGRRCVTESPEVEGEDHQQGAENDDHPRLEGFPLEP